MKGLASIFLLSLLMGASSTQAQGSPKSDFDGDGFADSFSFQGTFIVVALRTGGGGTTRLPSDYDPSPGSLGNGHLEAQAPPETGGSATPSDPSTSIPTWMPNCLCKRGSAWVGHFANQAVGAHPSVGDVVILASSGEACYSRSCENGTSLTSGSKKVKVVRLFIKPHSSEVFRWSLFGEEVP